MSIFDDKVFNELDFMSQAVEPYEFPPNAILASMEDQYEVPVELMLTRASGSDISPWIRDDKLMRLIGTTAGLTDEQQNILQQCYTIILDESQCVLDLENDIYPRITVNKKYDQFSHADMLQHIYVACDNIFSTIQQDDNFSRINEVLDILDANPKKISSRSWRKKRTELGMRWHSIINDDEWKLRDARMMCRVADWIKRYINDGNLAAIKNLSLLKVLTHKEQVIYSMVEEEIL